MSGSSGRTGLIAAAAAGLVVAGVLFFSDPYESGCSPWLPPCPLHALTGFYCSGCGSTRALYRLLHLNLAGAWRMNPAAVLAVPLIVGLFLKDWLAVRHPWARRPWPAWFIPTLLAAVLLWGVLRNLPWWPFTTWIPRP